MALLKWIVYGLLSSIGLCLAIGVSVLLTFIGATISSLMLGLGLIAVGAIALKEHLEDVDTPKKKDE